MIIQELIEQYKKISDDLIQEIAIICHSNPGIPWDDAWGMSLHERTLVVKQLKEIADMQQQAMDKASGKRTI